MTEFLFGLVTDYGVWVIFASCYLSCLLIPIPSSLMMLASGAMAAVGDMVLWQVALAAFAGAVLGDQSGYRIGRTAGDGLGRLTKNSASRQKLLTRAHTTVEKHGGIGVFLSTWLFAPLGPWVNMVAGATRMNWVRFSFWDTLGEAIWVSAYVGLGYVFSTSFSAVGEILSNAIGFVTGLAMTGLLGMYLLRRARRQKS
ncbi:DedA family protein [Donghicola sp. C2-DW-16]|uniref:DedA family protein n=1 Tax=Donghicola mangrovi TaxID=2729614 RepID=A0ABX2PDD6_9RHOB|nr:DedA family protein [Donghicola mangrovi]NVO26852.1 DedA family protein [Donghicola mangrovi]